MTVWQGNRQSSKQQSTVTEELFKRLFLHDNYKLANSKLKKQKKKKNT